MLPNISHNPATLIIIHYTGTFVNPFFTKNAIYFPSRRKSGREQPRPPAFLVQLHGRLQPHPPEASVSLAGGKNSLTGKLIFWNRSHGLSVVGGHSRFGIQ